MDPSSSTVFVPGATSGIGRALAVALHERGSTVIAGGRRAEKLAELATEYPGIDTVEIDVADPASITRAAGEVLERHPDLDVLVTMAGVMATEDWHTAGFLGTAEEIVTTNVLGPIRLIAAFVEHLATRPQATIMTVSSGLAFVPLKVTPTYNATKAAIHQLSQGLRLQLADTAISVVELVPPAVQTDLMPGQAESDFAMPLDDYVAEVMGLIEASDADTREILVERVKFLRHAEAEGRFDSTVAALNDRDPHGD